MEALQETHPVLCSSPTSLICGFQKRIYGNFLSIYALTQFPEYFQVFASTDEGCSIISFVVSPATNCTPNLYIAPRVLPVKKGARSFFLPLQSSVLLSAELENVSKMLKILCLEAIQKVLITLLPSYFRVAGSQEDEFIRPSISITANAIFASNRILKQLQLSYGSKGFTFLYLLVEWNYEIHNALQAMFRTSSSSKTCRKSPCNLQERCCRPIFSFDMFLMGSRPIFSQQNHKFARSGVVQQ